MEFKSSSLTVPVLRLLSSDLPAIAEQLSDKVAQAPEFFRHSPLLIDLQYLQGAEPAVNVGEIVALAREQGLVPIGIRGGGERQRQDALALHLPVLGTPSAAAGTAAASAQAELPPEPAQIPPPTLENKTITQPVRSGQRVYARGDLIVTASVSAGAEIMAEGNIHVYGTLRGRALAGVQGKLESRIFCQDLQAELISIAGIYQLRDELEKAPRRRAVAISLADQALIIKDL